jgi:predicted AlkP superfamily pyrophosphatase or phosphodiesterase
MRFLNRILAVAATAASIGGGTSCAIIGPTAGATKNTVELVEMGSSRELRKRPKGAPQNSPASPGMLVIACDGIGRDLLYDLLRKGEMPALAALLGGRNKQGDFVHAHFEQSLLSTLPSITMAAWATAMTGKTPAQHGVTGNEFFVRETHTLAAPAPVSFNDSAPTMEIYTHGYMNDLTLAPTVYERMRQADPDILIWVAMHQIYRGADRLLVAKPLLFAKAFEAFLEGNVRKVAGGKNPRGLYQDLDESVVDVVVDTLDKGAVPDVLTVYIGGADLYAHVAEEGPDDARSAYLKEVVDPQLARLAAKLSARGALANRYIVVTADHGHTEVRSEDEHALGVKPADEAPAVLKAADFRVRSFQLKVSDKADFQSVLTYEGAMAFVYLADRSTCVKADTTCDWQRPPRYKEDVLPAAQAFHDANRGDSHASKMKGALDMILTRKPRVVGKDDTAFEVYLGDGKLMPVGEYLKTHPHPTYVRLEERLRDLGVGPHGDHAGDVLLIAQNGNRDKPEDRYYFATRYHSWHGSPSRQDSEIPLIVAHPNQSRDDLHLKVKKALRESPTQDKLTDLLLELRRADHVAEQDHQ